MKKTIVSAASIIALSICCATGYSQATTQSVGGANPRPQSVGVGGANPRPTIAPPATSTIAAILMALGLI